MIKILKKQNGMDIIGQVGKIILFTLPSFVAANVLQAIAKYYRVSATALSDDFAELLEQPTASWRRGSRTCASRSASSSPSPSPP